MRVSQLDDRKNMELLLTVPPEKRKTTSEKTTRQMTIRAVHAGIRKRPANT